MATGGKGGQTKQTLATDIALSEYRLRLRDNVRSLRDNFTEIVKLSKVPTLEESKNNDRRAVLFAEQHEMEVRAANMARAGESLLRLISDLKQFCCLNDFSFINRTIAEANVGASQETQNIDKYLGTLRDTLFGDLVDLEQEYMSTVPPTTHLTD